MLRSQCMLGKLVAVLMVMLPSPVVTLSKQSLHDSLALATVTQQGAVEVANANDEDTSISSGDDRRRRSRRRSDRRRGRVDIEFGGAEQMSDTKGDLHRPELVKSLRCNGLTQCSNCEQQSSCWHGVHGYGAGGEDGQLVIDVTEDDSDSFVAEVFLACGGSGTDAKLELQLHELLNAKLLVFVDGTQVDLEDPVEGTQVTEINAGNWQNMEHHAHQLQSHLSPNFKGTVRLVLQRTPGTSHSRARIEFDARKVATITNECMDVKACLNVFGDGSVAGFQIRNDNSLQLACLQNQMQSMTQAQKDKCAEWKACLSQNPSTMETLKTFLEVAFATATGLIQTQKVTRTQVCVDPAVDDPESLECNCYDNALATCQPAEATDICLKRFMCNSAGICDSWKQGRCSGQGLLTEQNHSQSDAGIALLEKRQARTAASSGSGTRSAVVRDDGQLDDTLTDKCTG
jgi:hypothetical protein